ncbi:MAG: IspD/TarI family cytidylyltransferase [Nitrospirota bacterium]|nr:IspD/TarI family cytidylyltransferase [Nitrospirota bacterium]
MSVGVILAAGGRGVRMGRNTPKQFLELFGRPIYINALSPFLGHPDITRVLIGMPEDYVSDVLREIEFHCPSEVHSGRISVYPGGKRRQDTVERGVRLLAQWKEEISGVLVHDAARPFLSSDVLDRAVQALNAGRAVGVGVPVSDTLWKLGESDGLSEIREIVSRESMIAAQTPQGGPLDLFLEALDRAQSEQRDFTDEASLFLWAGIPFFLVEGSTRNRKITRPEDLEG